MTDLRARIKAEQLAAEKWPPRVKHFPSGTVDLNELYRNAFVDGYLAARTITTEELEAAAKAVCRAHQDMDGDYPWDVQFEDGKEEYRDWARATLTAAGLLIEGEDDEQ